MGIAILRIIASMANSFKWRKIGKIDEWPFARQGIYASCCVSRALKHYLNALFDGIEESSYCICIDAIYVWAILWSATDQLIKRIFYCMIHGICMSVIVANKHFLLHPFFLIFLRIWTIAHQCIIYLIYFFFFFSTLLT